MSHDSLTSEAYALLAEEAHLLDDRAYASWLELFVDDCLYWMPVDPESGDGTMRLNVFYDDRARMEDRVTRLSSGSAYTEEPVSLTSRTFSALQIVPEDNGCLVRSNFMMVAYRSGEQRLLGGRYQHRLVRSDGVLRIAEKRVTLLGSDAPQRPMTFLF
jgi:3-phenylpropionate/cinnamic acid dioxygenase small subunit